MTYTFIPQDERTPEQEHAYSHSKAQDSYKDSECEYCIAEAKARIVKRCGEYEGDSVPAYAWPGGYPIFYVTFDTAILCPKCASKTDNLVTVQTADINYEDASLYCDDCNERIESAYAEDEQEDN
jgi:hypothetical protein